MNSIVKTCSQCKYFDKKHSFCNNDYGLTKITGDDYCSKLVTRHDNVDDIQIPEAAPHPIKYEDEGGWIKVHGYLHIEDVDIQIPEMGEENENENV